jgi:5-hydroxyisourate hydrolase
MSAITTHVLDTARGRPAEGVPIALEIERDGRFERVGAGATDGDGRLRDLLPAGTLAAATYRLTFDTAEYFARHATAGFYPRVQIDFIVRDVTQHHHVPLLISAFGYSTYRGS